MTNIMVIGGMRSSGKITSSTMLTFYGPDAKLQSVLPSSFELQTARHGHETVKAKDSLITLGGIDSSGGAVATVEQYSFVTQRTQPIAGMPEARERFACVVMGDQVFMFGGHNPNGWRNYYDSYDMATDKWKGTRGISVALSACAAAVCNGLIYVTGDNRCLIYNPSTDTWKNGANMISSRKEHCVAEMNGYIYACGGQSVGSKCEKYDLATDKWSEIAPMNVERWNSTVIAKEGKLYAIGGRNKQQTYLGSVEVYNSKKNTWSLIEDAIEPLSQHSAVLL